MFIAESETPGPAGAGDANLGDLRNGPGVRVRPRPRPRRDDALGRGLTTPSCMLEGGWTGAGSELPLWTGFGVGMRQGGDGGIG